MIIPFKYLFVPGTATGLVPPDFNAKHKILDRVISVKKNLTIPLGSKGTIIGINEKKDDLKNVYEIFFDTHISGKYFNDN